MDVGGVCGLSESSIVEMDELESEVYRILSFSLDRPGCARGCPAGEGEGESSWVLWKNLNSCRPGTSLSPPRSVDEPAENESSRVRSIQPYVLSMTLPSAFFFPPRGPCEGEWMAAHASRDRHGCSCDTVDEAMESSSEKERERR